ncbi:MAG TPA: hypothetical protein VIZ31_02130 [Vicinamibacteria bacterium]
MSRSRQVVFTSMTVVIVGALAALGVLVLEPARAAVGPLPGEGLSLPADARFVAGFDVKRLTESPFYQKYAQKGGRPDAFADVEARIGLNPERDLDQVLVAGQDGNTGTGVAMVLGRFDRTKLMRMVEARKDEVTWKALSGTNVYLFKEGSRRAAALAFLDDRTLVIGTQAGVEATVASHTSGAAGLKGNKVLLGLLEQVKPGSAFWMVGDQSLLKNLPNAIPAPHGGSGSVTLPNLQSLLVTGDLESAVSVSVTGETTDEAAAKNLADIVRGFAAFMVMQASQKPELKDLGSAINVSTEGRRVLLSARFPYEMLDALEGQRGPATAARP